MSQSEFGIKTMKFEWDENKAKYVNNISQTDWEKVNKLSDDEIDFSDIPETAAEFWEDTEWFLPPKQGSLIDVL